ncbi:MAG: hypothetical protein RLZZ241_1120 [Bacteroidota bacterium]|jgi:hypothetical protein
MKKVLILINLMVLPSMFIWGQDRDRDRIQDQDQTKILALDGTFLQIRDRAELRLQDRQTLSDGTVIQPNGSYIAANGKRYRLAEGECLDGEGALYRNEYQYRHKIEKENAGLSQAQVQLRNQERLHYTMIDGDVYQIRHQEQIRLQEQLKLENGTTVFPDGTYQLENQARKGLENGACLDPSGQLFRNTYMFQKQMILKRAVPAKNMVRKGVSKPDISG